MSNEATKIYSTWFSTSPLGYCDRSFLRGWASGLYLLGAESEECCEDIPLEGVLEEALGSDVRFRSIRGGFGDLEGLLECRDMVEGDLEEGNEDREVLRFAVVALPFELQALELLVGGRIGKASRASGSRTLHCLCLQRLFRLFGCRIDL